MRITPLDIIQKDFTPNRRGVDADEVKQFLDQVREALEETLKEKRDLEEQLRQRDMVIARMQSAESQIKDTLVLAQQLSKDIEGNARREADLVVGEARLEAQRIIAASHDEHRDLLQEVHRLKGSRHALVAELRAVITTHGRLLDEVEQS